MRHVSRRTPAVLACLAMLSTILATGARANELQPREVGRMPIYSPPTPGNFPTSPNVSLVLNPETRRAYQLYHPSGPSSWITAFDLRSLPRPRLIGTIQFNGGFLKASGSHVVDEDGGRVFLPINDTSGVGFGGVAVLDEKAFRPDNAAAIRVLSPPSPDYSQLRPVGMRFEPRVKKLLILFDHALQSDVDGVAWGLVAPGAVQPAYLTRLAQLDAATGNEDWAIQSPCGATLSAAPREGMVLHGPSAAPFLSRDGRAVNIVCAGRGDNLQFVRFALDADGSPTRESTVFPGLSSPRQVLVDPVRQRTHVLVGADAGSFTATFDWPKERIEGTIALSRTVGAGSLSAGLDHDAGRIYAMVPPMEPTGGATIPGAFLVADGRRTPLPQALAFPSLADITNFGGGPIVVDPARDGRHPHVFFRPMKNTTQGQPYYRIFVDPIPVGRDPPPGELDRTIDVDETESSTLRAFSGVSSGYGSRVFSFGGGTLALSGEAVTPTIGRCPGANREVVAASLNGASLSNVTAAARLSPARTDHATESDLEDLSGCWPDQLVSSNTGEQGGEEPPEAIKGYGPAWGTKSGLVTGDVERPTDAECSGTDDGAGRDPRLDGAEAHASCKQEQETVTGSAAYPAMRFGPVTIGRSFVESVLRRDPKLGVVAEMRSVAEAIDIAGVGTIDAVRSFAMARANGRKPRPGDPVRTVWTVELCGVRTATFQQPGCASADAAFEALNAASDRAPQYDIRVLRPTPDPDLLKGSPGGFIAGVQRDVGESIIVALENGDTHAAVPGLEIRIAARGSGRYVLQLAGVQTAAVYGISLLPGSQAPDGAVIPPVFLPPVVVPPPLLPRPDTGTNVQRPGPIDDITRVVRRSLGVALRASLDALLAAGIWSIVATPMYLVLRRRRLRLAR